MIDKHKALFSFTKKFEKSVIPKERNVQKSGSSQDMKMSLEWLQRFTAQVGESDTRKLVRVIGNKYLGLNISVKRHTSF